VRARPRRLRKERAGAAPELRTSPACASLKDAHVYAHTADKEHSGRAADAFRWCFKLHRFRRPAGAGGCTANAAR
jgi:hypothetical protein